MSGAGGGQGGGLYADPMVYDILYTPGTAAEIDALERIERQLAGTGLPPDRLWLEPACGTGRCLRTAARRGRRVAGYDRDAAQIAYARRRLPRAVLFEADLRDCLGAAAAAGLVPGSVPFAFNTVNTLRHLPDDAAVLRHLDQTSRLLGSGGLYVVGLSLTDYAAPEFDEDLWEAARGPCRVSQLVNYLPCVPGTARDRSERVISHLTVARPRGVEHRNDAYDLRTYSEIEWADLIRSAGWKRRGSFDAAGRPLAACPAPYQLEALTPDAR